MDRKSFVLYTASKEIVDELSIEQTGTLFKSILEYVTDGEPLEMDGMTKIVFKTICSYLEKDFATYQMKCEKNKANGSKGGRPKGSTNKAKETQENRTVFSKTQKNIDYEYESESDYEYDSDSKEKGKKKNVKKRQSQFEPPTIDEVRQYIESKGYAVDPQRFYDYYDANNWHDKDGKPVKSWKQKIITWSGRNGNQESNTKRKGTGVTISDEQRKGYIDFDGFFDS